MISGSSESNRMKSAYFTIHPGKKYSSSEWLLVENRSYFRALVSHPPLCYINQTFHKTIRPPLHQIPVSSDIGGVVDSLVSQTRYYWTSLESNQACHCYNRSQLHCCIPIVCHELRLMGWIVIRYVCLKATLPTGFYLFSGIKEVGIVS